MKLNKIISILFTLCIIFIAAIFTFTHTTSAEDQLLKANIEALANVGESQLCWESGVFDSQKSLGICNSDHTKCVQTSNKTYPATGGVQKFCPF